MTFTKFGDDRFAMFGPGRSHVFQHVISGPLVALIDRQPVWVAPGTEVIKTNPELGEVVVIPIAPAK